MVQIKPLYAGPCIGLLTLYFLEESGPLGVMQGPPLVFLKKKEKKWEEKKKNWEKKAEQEENRPDVEGAYGLARGP